MLVLALTSIFIWYKNIYTEHTIAHHSFPYKKHTFSLSCCLILWRKEIFDVEQCSELVWFILGILLLLFLQMKKMPRKDLGRHGPPWVGPGRSIPLHFGLCCTEKVVSAGF